MNHIFISPKTKQSKPQEIKYISQMQQHHKAVTTQSTMTMLSNALLLIV